MTLFERLSEPLHRKLDIPRLKLPPAVDHGLISILRIALEIFPGVLPRVGLFFGELLSDKRVFCHPPAIGYSLQPGFGHSSFLSFRRPQVMDISEY